MPEFLLNPRRQLRSLPTTRQKKIILHPNNLRQDCRLLVYLIRVRWWMSVLRYEPHIRPIKYLARLPQIQMSQLYLPYGHTPRSQEEHSLDFKVEVIPLLDFHEFLPKLLDIPRVE